MLAHSPLHPTVRRATVALIGALALAATIVPLAGTSAGANVPPPLPVKYSFSAGIAYTMQHGTTASPPGANDWSCKPSAAHPYPVVLVHGTLGNMADSWNALSPLLKNNGYCVFALNYGGSLFDTQILYGVGDIPTSAQQLGAFIDKVLTSTGAAKVDIVGHSQGGMMPRYYMKFDGGAAKVDTLVGLSPSNHGTTLFGLTALMAASPTVSPGGSFPAATQQVTGSAFLQKLNAGGDTLPGVHYTVIETRYDEVVTPYQSEFLSGSNVTNELVQSSCALDFAEHLAIIYDHVALRLTLNALDPAHAQRPACSVVLPGEGG